MHVKTDFNGDWGNSLHREIPPLPNNFFASSNFIRFFYIQPLHYRYFYIKSVFYRYRVDSLVSIKV